MQGPSVVMGVPDHVTAIADVQLIDMSSVSIADDFDLADCFADSSLSDRIDATSQATALIDNVTNLTIGDDFEIAELNSTADNGTETSVDVNLTVRDSTLSITGKLELGNIIEAAIGGFASSRATLSAENSTINIGEFLLIGEISESETMDASTDSKMFLNGTACNAPFAKIALLLSAMGEPNGLLSMQSSHLDLTGAPDASPELQMQSGAGLLMHLDGTTRTTIATVGGAGQYAAIDIAGTASLAGHLRVVFGFTPVHGDTFDILNAQVILGDFADFSIMGLPAGLNAVTEVVPDGLGGFFYRVRITSEFGTSLCTGDGGDQQGCNDCPCDNNAPFGSGGGCLNSSGSGARIEATGDTSVSLPSGSTTDLRVALSGAPASAFCVLSSGDAVAPANMANPCFGLDSGVLSMSFDGMRCAIVNTRRHGGRAADTNGDVGVTNNPWGGEGGPPAGIANAGTGFSAGQTRYFQVTHRDDPSLVCMRGLNTSQAVEVTFTP